MQQVATSEQPVRVSSTDWLKLVGIAAFILDHIGLFFIEDAELFRIAGRVAAPIFFFLIGFARSRQVPLSWIVLGVALTALDVWIDGADEFSLNILLNFAAVRLALRVIDYHAATPLRLAIIAGLCVFAIPTAGLVFEYGAEGWLWALFGFAQRRFRDGDMQFKWLRFGFAALAIAIYAAVEIEDHEFEDGEEIALVAALIALGGLLLLFQRRTSPLQPPAFLMRPVQIVSRYSLEIYAFSLFVMQVIAHVIE